MSDNILKQMRVLFNSAKGKQNNIFEWSVGDLGTTIAHNITDKVSLKSIKKDDIIVVAKTSVYPLAKEQEKGDVQLTVTSVSGTNVDTEAKNGEKVSLDLLDMRILEAYSRENSSVRIFVVDLPTRINKNKFAESFEDKGVFIKTVDKYVKDLTDFSDKVIDESDKEGVDNFQALTKSPLVKKIIVYLNDVYKYFDNFDKDIIRKLDKKGQLAYRYLIDQIIDAKTDASRDYFYLGTSIDGVIYRLNTFKKAFENNNVV